MSEPISDKLVKAAYESALDDRLINPRLVVPIIDRMRAAEAEIAGLRSAIAQEERFHLQSMEERDAAEDAMSDAYAAVTGQQAEWSNAFGYNDAINEISEVVNTKDALLAQILPNLQLAEEKVDQHLQGQYNYMPYRALGVALQALREALATYEAHKEKA